MPHGPCVHGTPDSYYCGKCADAEIESLKEQLLEAQIQGMDSADKCGKAEQARDEAIKEVGVWSRKAGAAEQTIAEQAKQIKGLEEACENDGRSHMRDHEQLKQARELLKFILIQGEHR
jgi:chromosome segregation ATPase